MFSIDKPVSFLTCLQYLVITWYDTVECKMSLIHHDMTLYWSQLAPHHTDPDTLCCTGALIPGTSEYQSGVVVFILIFLDTSRSLICIRLLPSNIK